MANAYVLSLLTGVALRDNDSATDAPTTTSTWAPWSRAGHVSFWTCRFSVVKKSRL
ncbi:hypothetical protein ACWCW7_22500 [Nocardia tengchongensis]